MHEPLTEVFRKRKESKQKPKNKGKKIVDLNQVKADEENNLLINKFNIITSSEKSECEKDLKDTIDDIKKLLKKEIPGVTFNDENIKHSTNKIDNRYTIHTDRISLFKMTDENCKKYMEHSKSKDLQTADNSWDYVEEMVLDNEERIFKPIEKLGFKRDEDGEWGDFIKNKNGKVYITITVGDEVAFFIDIALMVTIDSGETVTEAKFIPKSINDIFKKRKNDVENAKPLPKRISSRQYNSKDVERELKDIINYTNNLIKKDYKDFIGKGIKLTTFGKSFYDDKFIEKDEVGEFFNSEDAFTLFSYELWDYPSKMSPREILGDTGTHPVYEVCDEIVKQLRKYVDEKYPRKYDIDFYGDWDDGPYVLVLV